MNDRYSSFAELSRHEREGADFIIAIDMRDSPVAVIAPHGGSIEPNTTETARAIADGGFKFYSFIGLGPDRPHCDLHITSHRFDEPRCIALLRDCRKVVAIHGRNDNGDSAGIYLGGLDADLKRRVNDSLTGAGFSTRMDGHKFPALNPSNICNRGQSGRGVQIELPRSLRDRFAAEPQGLEQFSAAVRMALRG